MKNWNPTVFALLSIFFICSTSCTSQNKYSIDEYEFYMPGHFEEWPTNGDENVLLALSDPVGISIMIQNKLNILKTTFFSHLDNERSLKAMHQMKFDSYVASLNGYDITPLEVRSIGQVLYSYQAFKYREAEGELAYDLRIVLLGNDYYAFYSFDQASKAEQNKKTLDDLIQSLSQENF